MSIIQVESSFDDVSNRQRTAHLLTLILAAALFGLGLNARSAALLATTPYADSQAGIRLNYPRNWLLQTGLVGTDDFVFQVRDMTRIGYKTTIQISIEPIGADTTERNVLDSLSMRRASTLATYNILRVDQDFLLPNDIPAYAMSYAYVETETNPFLESIPVVVEGLDILAISRGQALVITFRSDAQTFGRDLAIFNRFLRTLDF